MPSTTLHVRLGGGASPVGRLIFTTDGPRETSVFTYSEEWLRNPRNFALAPDMPLGLSPFHFNKAAGDALPPPIGDGTPDSWGRAVIKASLGGRHCTDLDFLLQTSDFLRAGALRYYESPDEDAPALARHDGQAGAATIPRLHDLDSIIVAARAFETDPARYREKRAEMVGGDILKDAVGSLGGARPKVNAIDGEGALWIVKLARVDDQFSVAHAEVLALRLASRVGILAAEARVLPSPQGHPVAIVRRFDRGSGSLRIPFISGQTFMGLPGATLGNYADVAFRMMAWSADPAADRLELYRRVAYEVLIQNADNHLRNLGFLIGRGRKWRLSPAFDLNPVPERGVTMQTAISELHGAALDVDALIDAAPLFEMPVDEAAKLVAAMARTIRDSWRSMAHGLGMTGEDVRFISPAFDNPQVERAIQLSA